MDISRGRLIVWNKTSYKDASVVIDPEDDREEDGRRTSLTGLVYTTVRVMEDKHRWHHVIIILFRIKMQHKNIHHTNTAYK